LDFSLILAPTPNSAKAARELYWLLEALSKYSALWNLTRRGFTALSAVHATVTYKAPLQFSVVQQGEQSAAVLLPTRSTCLFVICFVRNRWAQQDANTMPLLKRRMLPEKEISGWNKQIE